MQDRSWWLGVALSGALVVMLGAFAAHGLSGQLTPRLEQAFTTGVRYQAWHTLAALAVLAWRTQIRFSAQRYALMLWAAGTLLFSGSLYAMGLAALAGTGLGAFAVVTPVGGLALVLGWLALAAGVWRQR
ncbi:DUF423 domain-containing protein [Halomonas sp. V046]|uniref:DUF423 domain-containing protein n=1 Tax=Halomonas sp. V046 TaxID=3459611 RepID=UPI0040444EA5